MKTRIIGFFLLFEAAFMLITSLVALYYFYRCGDGDVLALTVSTIITSISGFILISAGRSSGKHNSQEISNFEVKDSFFIVTITWFLFALFGMLPFLLNGTVSNVADAFFEAMSGFTTTGSTVLNNIDEQPHGILFWRSIMQWLGGLGIIVLFLAVMPALNRSSNKVMMFSAEMSGIGVKKLHPKMMMTARKLLGIYVILTILCAFMYWLGPMNAFDAICHALTTLSSGGFSTHQASISYYNSPYIEYVASFFMFSSGINFSLYYLLITGEGKLFRENEELRWYIGAVILMTTIIIALFYLAPKLDTVLTNVDSYPEGFENRFRTSLFHVTSIITSTCFQATNFDYDLWGGLFLIPTFIMMASGACAGSTSGGIKIIREVITIKSINNIFRRLLHPNAMFSVKVSNEVIDDDKTRRVINFLIIFLLLYIMGVLLFIISGCNLEESMFNCISALGNSGPGIGSTGPSLSFSELSVMGKWTMSILMLVGRLEIYTVLVTFLAIFRGRKY
ncbi:MAG: TrkH family potassium uptake protein [Bacteroidales bacterium]|nr:TrkH family potassium uptake protein [Bacteroidales bacterium]